MPTVVDETCFTCRWWKTKGPGLERLAKDKGICFFGPPTPVAIPLGSAVSQQITVQPIGIRPTTGALDPACHGYRGDLVKKGD